MTVLTETDVVDGHLPGYHRARRPDGPHFRAWEIPGTAHADNYTIRVGFIDTASTPLEQIVAAYAPTNELMGRSCRTTSISLPSTTTYCRQPLRA